MALNNPDILYPLLNDLSFKIRHLNHRISYAMDDAEHIMQVTIDQTGNAIFDTHYMANLKDEDQDKIGYHDRETKNMLNKADTLMQEMQLLQSRLMQVKNACDKSLRYWNNEHAKALAWLESANASLAHAEYNLNMALRRLRSAEAELSSAQSALNNCRNSYKTDNQGRRIYNNCSGYEQQVSNAKYAVQRARDECRRWEIERNNAEAEVAQAEARVNGCIQSLEIVRQAISNNNVTLNIANEAANFCQRCVEEIRSAADAIGRAKANNNWQHTLVQENRTHLDTARNLSNDASNSFHEANKLAGDVQQYGNLACEEVDKKVDLLKEFSISPPNL